MAVVNCVTYAGGRRLYEVKLADVSEVLKQPEGFVWIGLVEPSEQELRQVQEEFGLHDLAIEDAHRAHQRPKMEEYGDSLFVVLRTVQQQDGDLTFGETHVFVGARYIVTVRHGASLSYGEVRARCEASPDYLKQGPGFVLYAIMDFVVDHYFPVIDGLEDELEKLEDEIFQEIPHRKLIARHIYQLKRQMLFLKRSVSPLIEVCNRLARFDRKLIEPETRLYFRDVYDHVIRINESIDGMRELLTSALETNLALVSVRQNEVMKRLGAGAALITVPTMIAGIYGMNFEHMPELKWMFGYPFSILFMVAVCGYLYSRFRKAGWL
ncbi:MAG: magnesium/cobalt transporter CorA [Candidatus Binatia bacterium]